MPSFDPELSLDVADNEILVTLQGTSYAVTYFNGAALLDFLQRTSSTGTIGASE
jgi:hypothetical protein